jgi:hypothetical protein
MGLLSANPGPNTAGRSNLTAEMAVALPDAGSPSMTFAILQVNTPANTVLPGTPAWTSDVGFVVSNGTSWVSIGSSSGGGGYGNSVSVTLATSQDNLNPAGYTPGITNRIIATPATGGSAVLGLLAAADGTSILVVNPSSTDSLTFPYHGSSTSTNQFSTQNGSTQTLEPLSNAIITYVVNQWEFAS